MQPATEGLVKLAPSALAISRSPAFGDEFGDEFATHDVTVIIIILLKDFLKNREKCDILVFLLLMLTRVRGTDTL